jgi:transposase
LRVYKCWKCGIKWDRDKGVLYNLATEYFERLKREECSDALTLAERFLTSLKQLLGEHPKALER